MVNLVAAGLKPVTGRAGDLAHFPVRCEAVYAGNSAWVSAVRLKAKGARLAVARRACRSMGGRERAGGVGELSERFLAGHGLDQSGSSPRYLELAGLLDLHDVHLMFHQAVGADLAVIGEHVVDNGKIRADGLMEHEMYIMQVDPRESKYAWDYYRLVQTMSGEEALESSPTPPAHSRPPH